MKKMAVGIIISAIISAVSCFGNTVSFQGGDAVFKVGDTATVNVEASGEWKILAITYPADRVKFDKDPASAKDQTSFSSKAVVYVALEAVANGDEGEYPVDQPENLPECSG